MLGVSGSSDTSLKLWRACGHLWDHMPRTCPSRCWETESREEKPSVPEDFLSIQIQPFLTSCPWTCQLIQPNNVLPEEVWLVLGSLEPHIPGSSGISSGGWMVCSTVRHLRRSTCPSVWELPSLHVGSPFRKSSNSWAHTSGDRPSWSSPSPNSPGFLLLLTSPMYSHPPMSLRWHFPIYDKLTIST